MDGKLSASLRVSAMTTAPSAPSASSSHMNQNRCWPGVPNRYTTRSSRTVMRPKSIATVVVDFCSTPARSSTSRLGSLSVSSVRSGRISLIDATSVVLPAPKPPAMRILMASGDGLLSSSKPAEGICDILENSRVGQASPRRFANGDQAAFAHVREQNPDNAKRQINIRRQVGDRYRVPAQLQHPQMLRFKEHPIERAPVDRGGHDREQVNRLAAGPGPAAGQRVRPDDRTRFAVEPVIVGHRVTLPRPC